VLASEGVLPPVLSGSLELSSESAGDDDAEQYKEMMVVTSQKIETLDEEMRKISKKQPEKGRNFLKFLSADQESSVRITALQWLASMPDTEAYALTTALKDNDPAIQSAAIQLLLDRGIEGNVNGN
jgi:hypothetical protein